MLLAIETSCDESAIALFDGAGKLVLDLVSSQVQLHRPYGGVVPELAARAHLENLPALVDELHRQFPNALQNLRAVAVTQGPGLKGCLLVGLCFAKALAFRRGLPIFPINHLEGHILAGGLLEEELQPKFPFLALLVSGGHTSLVSVRGVREYEVIAETMDDAVGEAFDKCATLLGLPYPGGPTLSRLAATGDATQFQFPVGVPQDGKSFSFSGVKTAFAREISRQNSAASEPAVRANLAAAIEKTLVDSLLPKTIKAAGELGVQDVLLTGGVAANLRLRKELSEALTSIGVRTVILPPKWCGDNAAMIGEAALQASGKGMGECRSFESIDVLPRFPLSDVSNGPAV